MSRNLGVQGTDETGSCSPPPSQSSVSVDTGGLVLGVRMGLSVLSGLLKVKMTVLFSWCAVCFSFGKAKGSVIIRNCSFRQRGPLLLAGTRGER